MISHQLVLYRLERVLIFIKINSDVMANVTTIIALVVLVLFAIVYLTLFIMLGKAKKMTITAKLEDDFVLKIMIKDYIAMEKEGFLKGFKAYYQKRKKQDQTSDAVLTAITTFIILLFVVLMSFSLIFKANDQLIYFGNTTYLVVRTNSMENISNVNEYVEENELFNQIKPNSLIVIEKKDTYDLYDVCAFKVEDEIIVHRIIKIEYDKEIRKLDYKIVEESVQLYNLLNQILEYYIIYDDMENVFYPSSLIEINWDTICGKIVAPSHFLISYFLNCYFGKIEDKETKTTNNNNSSKYDEIRKIKELLDMGAITQEEFEIEKRKLLSN